MEEIDFEKKFLKERNHGIWLSDEEVSILDRYEIPYQNCFQLTEILYYIDRILEEEEIEELENISIQISERNYYQNTNK